MQSTVSITDEQKSYLLKVADSCLDTLTQKAAIELNMKIVKPSLCLSQRGKIAGSALLQKYHIRLNAILFWQNQSAFIEDVIPHELAHLIVYERYSTGFRNKVRNGLGKSAVKPHGKEWQSIMKGVFKRPAHVTHAFEVKDVMQATFEYECHCDQPVLLSLIRHNKVIRNKQSYRCRKCKEVLRPKTCVL